VELTGLLPQPESTTTVLNTIKNIPIFASALIVVISASRSRVIPWFGVPL
jgi:hypothetical protein